MYLKLAWRNLWRNSRRTMITISSIIFAVVFALMATSVNKGSHNQMIDNMARFSTGFIQVQDSLFKDEPSLDNAIPFDRSFADEIMQADSRIDFLTPRMQTYMLAAGEDITRGAIIIGIDLEKEHRLNQIKDQLVQGVFFEPGGGTVVMGDGLASRLHLSAGDTLVLLGQGRFGMSASGKYVVSGLIRHPITEMNNMLIYISLPDAQWLLSAEGYVTSLLVTPTQVRFSESVAASIREQLSGNSGLRVLSWPELMPELLQAIEFDMAGTYVFTGILYIVIGFGLFGTILTMTLERLREFGLLLSLGMGRLQLASVVFMETVMISSIGVLFGTAIGFLILYYFYLNPIQLTGDAADAILDYGFEPILPFSIAPELFYTQGIIVFVIAMVICIYPLMKIRRLNILEAARS